MGTSVSWVDIATVTIACLACISSFVVAIAGMYVTWSVSKKQNSTTLEISKVESKIALQVSAMQVEQQKANLLFEPKKDDVQEIMDWIEKSQSIQESNDEFQNMRAQGLPISTDDALAAYKFYREWDNKFLRIDRLAKFYDPSKKHYDGIKWGTEPLPTELGFLIGLLYLDVYSNTQREHNEISKLLIGEEKLDDEGKKLLMPKVEGFTNTLYKLTLDSLLRVRSKMAQM